MCTDTDMSTCTQVDQHIHTHHWRLLNTTRKHNKHQPQTEHYTANTILTACSVGYICNFVVEHHGSIVDINKRTPIEKSNDKRICAHTDMNTRTHIGQRIHTRLTVAQHNKKNTTSTNHKPSTTQQIQYLLPAALVTYAISSSNTTGPS